MSLKINDLLHIPPCDICRLPKMSSRLWTEAGHRIPMSNGAVYDENGKARIIHDHKLEALEDLIEAANGQPVLVAYWFKHDRQRIIDHLTHLKIPVRDIKSSTDIKDWNAGNIPVALIHPASAGHGLNIQQGGHILIWFGLTWSLELYQQTNARLWRQGQIKNWQVSRISTGSKAKTRRPCLYCERNKHNRLAMGIKNPPAVHNWGRKKVARRSSSQSRTSQGY